MAGEHFSHIVLHNVSQREKFSTPKMGGGSRLPSRVPNREAHAQALLQRLQSSTDAARDGVNRRAETLTRAQNGFYLTIQSRPAEPLLAERLEQRKKNIELLAVKEEHGTTTATLFVPESSSQFFQKKIEDYRTKDEPRSKEPEPKGRRLVDGIGDIRLANLLDFWTDDPDQFPGDDTVADWEVWLRPVSSEYFRQAARDLGAIVGSGSLVFPEDIALFVRASPNVLAKINDSSLAISRLSSARKTADAYISTKPPDQARQIEDFLARLQPPGANPNAICLLDTGITRTHPLLIPLLADADRHAYIDDWGVDDHYGHGTEMAGICGYGDLTLAFQGNGQFPVPYVLESVKTLPPVGRNPYDLYGAITAGCVAKAELAQPQRKRVFCLAVTTDEDQGHRGRPTSWSSELDQLCLGSPLAQKDARLFCVSAGNIREPQLAHADYPQFNDLQELESPAHAWNALAIGAHTEMTQITDATLAGWIPFANNGNLCPVSRTAAWNDTWPVKPDVVMEGGNYGVDPADGLGYEVVELRLLTTSREYPQVAFSTTGDTSAATANAARLCATLQSQYADLWPETIRALAVDSAQWTNAMLAYVPANPKKKDFALLLKRFGFGVPHLERALYSAANALTLIAEDSLQPFIKTPKKSVSLNEMKLFPLPWPLEELTALGNAEAHMRVTLSYFIEPNPAESARNQHSRYPSHGLRFAVKLPDEDLTEFRKRVNKAARQNNDSPHHESDENWLLGSKLRDRGSIHSDFWRGPASDLARRGAIAVYPTSGWWKSRDHLERYNRQTRFSLVVNIQTPHNDVDIYTAIANKIAIQI
jgi:hypothetical protein